MTLTFPAYNLIIFLPPSLQLSLIFFIFTRSDGYLILKAHSREFYYAFCDQKRNLSENSVFLSYETERSKAELKNTLIMMFSLTSLSLSLYCGHTHSYCRGVWASLIIPGRSQYVYMSMLECTHTYAQIHTGTSIRNTHWPEFWKLLLMHFMVIFHPAGQWSLSLKAKTKHRHHLACRGKRKKSATLCEW